MYFVSNNNTLLSFTVLANFTHLRSNIRLYYEIKLVLEAVVCYRHFVVGGAAGYIGVSY